MPPRLYRVILPVSDLDKAAKFYGTVLGMAGQRVSPGRHYFDCDGSILACFDPKREDSYEAKPNPEHIYFSVSDLWATLQRVEAGGASLQGGIEKCPWEEVSFFAHDPFGNPICFVERGTEFLGEWSHGSGDGG